MRNYMYFASSFILLFFFLQLLSGIILTMLVESPSYTSFGNYTSAENSFLVTIIIMAVSAVIAFLIQKLLSKRRK
ncbi:hypothetical protein [Alkalihalobacillus hwajinpoensis]|uniref:hypothetical protein n=1 Tax=Guptibacillus hwajinpoensis TaxID=208199 RepID=UPI0018840AD5|nr:hypothetical protein [Pseudalkalibacillus hwajinpoensis]